MREGIGANLLVGKGGESHVVPSSQIVHEHTRTHTHTRLTVVFILILRTKKYPCPPFSQPDASRPRDSTGTHANIKTPHFLS